MRGVVAVAAADLRASTRRRWIWGVTLAGALIAALIGLSAALADAPDDVERLHTWGFNLLLLGGVGVAIGLGASALNHDADRGFLGLVHAAGAGRSGIGLARAGSRLAVLAGVLTIWAWALQVASMSLGRGLDRALALLSLATMANVALVLLVCAGASTVVGSRTAGVVGAIFFATVQAFTNLGAAADQRIIGSFWRDVADATATLWPRQLHTPLSADLVNRGAGGPAGQRFEVNGTFATLPSAGWLTVAWFLAWAGAFVWLCVAGMRNREL